MNYYYCIYIIQLSKLNISIPFSILQIFVVDLPLFPGPVIIAWRHHINVLVSLPLPMPNYISKQFDFSNSIKLNSQQRNSIAELNLQTIMSINKSATPYIPMGRHLVIGT